jgi:excisionase family DNA binding protein
VRWHTGAADELTIARPGPGRTPDAALELIRRHGATCTSAELADMLNAAGLTTGKGKPFTAGGVARVRDAHKIFGPRTVAVRDGEVSVKEAAAQLGIPADAVYNWLAHDQVPARRARGGRWCIPWDPATQETTARKSPARSGSGRTGPEPDRTNAWRAR